MSGYDLVQDLAIVLVIAGIVGFIFQRIGLSNIVGFLVAGLLVGPHASRFGLVSDPGTIEGLSQLGLAFLMFSIGLDLSISKMRRFGLGVAVAVVISAALVFNTFRFLTPLLGVTGREPIFIAGMMVASSSAMIGKMLRDTGLLHQRPDNLAQFAELVSSLRTLDTNQRVHPFLHVSLQILMAIVLFAWLWVLAPVRKETLWFFGSALTVGIPLAIIFRQRFQRLQERIGSGLSEAILSPEERRKRTRRAWLSDYSDWELNLQEIKVPDSEKWFGRSIGELALRSRFSASVVGVERQGYVLSSPGPETLLFPDDTLLALGSDDQLRELRRFFEKAEPRSKSVDLLEEIRMEVKGF
jgi:TrkA-C domain/Sodium/hydrogen exchanger family